MFVEKDIQDKLYNLVGWRNNTLPNFTLDAANIVTESGLYFNDASPLVTLESLYNSLQPVDMDDATFNKRLKEINEAGIVRVCNDILAGQSSFIAQRGGVLNIQEKLPSVQTKIGSKFGYELEVNNSKVLIKLNSATFYAEQDESFTLKLYNTGNSAPVKEYPITLLANETKTEVLDYIVPLSLIHI